MADIFISYASEDEDRIRHLVKAFEKQGWSVFWDHRIPAGQTWRSYIGKGLAEARCVVVAWTKESVVSNWVSEEADEGKKRGVLVPVRLDEILPPIGFRSIQAADLSDWRPSEPSETLNQLIGDIGALLGVGPGSVTARKTSPPTTKTQPWSRKRFRNTLLYSVLAFIIVLAGIGFYQTRKVKKNSNATEVLKEPEKSTGNLPAWSGAPIISSEETTGSSDESKGPSKETKGSSDEKNESSPHYAIQKPFFWILDRSHQLKIANHNGEQLRTIANVNIDLSIGGNRVMSASYNGDFAITVSAYDVVDKLARYNMDGSKPWSIKSGAYTAVDVAKTEYSYAIKKGNNQSGTDIVQKINSKTGKIEKELSLPDRYFDIVVDEQNENVWVAGQAITLLSLDLVEKWTRDPIGWYAVSIDYAPDGTLLVAERKYGNNMGQNRLFNMSATGELKKSIALDFSPVRVVASREFWDVWVVGSSIVRFNPRDPSWDKPKILDIGPVSFADVSKDGSVWVTTANTILRVSRQGRVISKLSGFHTDKTCMDVISDN